MLVNCVTFFLTGLTSPLGYLILFYYQQFVYQFVAWINSILLTFFTIKYAITDDQRYIKVGLLTFLQLYGGHRYGWSKLYYFYNYFLITVFASQAIITLQQMSNGYMKVKLARLGEKVNKQIVVLTFLPVIIEWISYVVNLK